MMNEARKLATIAFADIAGYSAMMQADEVQALATLDIFSEILKREMPIHNGQIVQFFGDGCLLSFDSALEGLHAATALQGAFISQEVPVRIGMHIGDVVFKNNNAFGDGVNIASRVESLGIPGSILISKALRDQLTNKTAFVLQSLGDFHFKNIAEEMEVFAVANEGFVIPKPDQIRGKLETPRPPKASPAEQKEWEKYQLLEILDAIEEGSCVLILGNYAFSRPTGTGEIFLPEILRQEQEKLGKLVPAGDKSDVLTLAQDLIGRPGGLRALMRLADISWEELGPPQKTRFQQISEIPFDLILSTYPFDLCHEAFQANRIAHQYDFYSYLRESSEPEPFDATHPLIYNLFGSRQQRESMVISLDRLYQFLFSVLGARQLPKLIQDKVQRATQLVFLGFSFDDWYMKLLLRVLKVHEKDVSYAHPPGTVGLGHGNQRFYESNFQVTFLDRKIDEFVMELHALCQEEGLLRRPAAEATSNFQAIRSLVVKNRLEEALEQLDDILLQEGQSRQLLRELSEYYRTYHRLKEWAQYERYTAEELEPRWQSLQDNLFSLIDQIAAQQPV